MDTPKTIALSEFVGVEVPGRVQDFMNDQGKGILYKLFLEHRVLLFRNQDLDGDEQVQFAEMFGDVSRRDYMAKAAGGFAHISNNRADGILSNGELFFHADHCFYPDPLKAICLYAIEVPESGGETKFADASQALKRMPAELRQRIEGRTGLHLYDYAGDYGNRMLEENTSADAPRHEHPIIWSHPETGQEILLVNKISTAKINGLPREEGDELLDELASYVDNEELIYCHNWRPGDLLIWDNRALQHARMNFDPAQKRTIRRVPLVEFGGA